MKIARLFNLNGFWTQIELRYASKCDLHKRALKQNKCLHNKSQSVTLWNASCVTVGYINMNAVTHSYWTGNLGQTARHQEPGLSDGKRQDD